MPEIKQNFIKGKMNKDLDERLVPKGEYREAQNIHITESEGSDVGAVENIIGNLLVSSSTITSSLPDNGNDYEVIGYCKDLNNLRVVYFITNFSNSSNTDDIRNISRTNNAGSDSFADLRDSCAIVLYDINDKSNEILVSGDYLNLSKNHLITGVQIIDEMLFWTDNLNQPRKINIQTALDNYNNQSDQYYDCEETISLAKYAPYKAIMLHDDAANSNSLPSLDEAITSEYTKERFVRFSYRYKYDDGEYSLIAPFTQSIFEPLNNGLITNNDSSSNPDDERNSVTGEPEVLTGKKEVYKKGIVDIMQNRINKVELRIPLPNKNEFSTDDPGSTYSNPYHIEEIDIILKESDGISFKLVKTIKINEISSSDIESYTIQNRSDTDKYYRQLYKYTYKSSKPTTVLPESEVSRVFDQVPVIAKTLEAVGNRIVFGNYVENYPYPIDSNGSRGMNYTVHSVTKGVVDQSGVSGTEPYMYGLKQWMHKTYKYHTVKQRRTYQVGIVFSDIYGRQSPVILSSNKTTSELTIDPDTYTVPEVTDSFGSSSNTSAYWNTTYDSYGKSLVINFEDIGLTIDPKFIANMEAQTSSYNPHGWYSYRIVVKQQEQEYYNVYAPHTFDGWDNVDNLTDNSLSGGRSWLFLHGDNVNKVPRSLNDTDLNRDGTMGSNVRLYPKVVSSTTGESKMNNLYHELSEVISLGTAFEQNLFLSGDDNKSGTSGFSVLDFVYGKDKNPLVAELQNMKVYNGYSSINSYVLYSHGAHSNVKTITLAEDQDQTHWSSPVSLNNYVVSKSSPSHQEKITVVSTDTTTNPPEVVLSSRQTTMVGDKLVFTRYYEGLSVFETEPFKSNIDIYYETSTSGLVADLEQEIRVNLNDYASDLTIKQTYDPNSPATGLVDYNFGSGQPGLPYFEETNAYGNVAYLYENLDITEEVLISVPPATPVYGPIGPIPIGDLDATESVNSSGVKDLSFEIRKVTRLGDGSDATSEFLIDTETVDGVDVVKLYINSTFAYRGGGLYDQYDVVVAVTDNATNATKTTATTIPLKVRVEVKNSKPVISNSSGSYEIIRYSGEDSTLISGGVENGSAREGGSYNKYKDLEVTRSFANSDYDELFVIKRPNNETYKLVTTNKWYNGSNFVDFFADTEANRTVTIVATDAGGLSTSIDIIVDEKDIDVFSIYLVEIPTLSSYSCSYVADYWTQGTAITHYVTDGISGTDPNWDGAQPNPYVYVGNVIHKNQDLSQLAIARNYVIRLRKPNLDLYYQVLEVDSSGVISSITTLCY
jgi:hypothetical protein